MKDSVKLNFLISQCFNMLLTKENMAQSYLNDKAFRELK